MEVSMLTAKMRCRRPKISSKAIFLVSGKLVDYHLQMSL